MIEGEILGRTQAQDYVRLALFAIRIKGVKADDLAPGRLKPESRHAFRIST